MKKYLAFKKSIKEVDYQLTIDRYNIEEKGPNFIKVIKTIVNKWLQQIHLPATLEMKPDFRCWLSPIVNIDREYGVEYSQTNNDVIIRIFHFEPSYEIKETI